MFVQMHMLQSMPPGNLNRDDTGQPKKCLFGGTTRGRISSQCLKRNMRRFSIFQEVFGESLAHRTRLFPTLVANEMRDLNLISEDETEGVRVGVKKLFGGKDKKGPTDENQGSSDRAEDSVPQKSPSKNKSSDKTSQVVFFPPLFVKKVAELLGSLKKDSKAWDRFTLKKKKKDDKDDDADKVLKECWAKAYKAKESLSVDIALFGRMTTSALIQNVEASCQVAHAIGTHETLTESDYFTAVDELDGGGGAGFVSDSEAVTFFNAAVYYKYLNVDTDTLMRTLGECGAGHAQRATGVLLRAAALATPTGKQNSFAAHSVPELILVEMSQCKQPISYANAFLQAVQGQDLMRESAQALSNYCGSIASAYAPPDVQRFLLTVGSAASVSFPLETIQAATLLELANLVEGVLLSPAAVGAV